MRIRCTNSPDNRGPLSYFIEQAKKLAKECERKCSRGRRGTRCRKRVKKCKDEASIKVNC